ncbi:MAG TPA: type II toxin-antitoxin system HigB family toxin [Planctomycetota bacterium]|nr:type II toxin-antitoxin system HigB family toxin [Planctomycetota bacterium]
MRVISLRRLREFRERHGDAEIPLRNWFRTARKARWRSLQDVRRAYPHADGVSTPGGEVLTVFNIGGNKYRLVSRIRYDFDLVNVRVVLTHAEYARGTRKD